MLLTHTVIDLGDSVANTIAVFAVIVSLIALFTADSRAKEANKIALDANATSLDARDIAREANRISERSLSVSQVTEARERNLALKGPLEEVLELISKMRESLGSGDFERVIHEGDSARKALVHVGAVAGIQTSVAGYIESVIGLISRMEIAYTNLHNNWGVFVKSRRKGMSEALEALDDEVGFILDVNCMHLSNVSGRFEDDDYWVWLIDVCKKFGEDIDSAATLVSMLLFQEGQEDIE